MSTVTIKDIAERAGVSKTIVSQFLNQNYRFMSAETKAKIARVVKEANYIPSRSARNLKFKKVRVVNIIVANISSAFSTEVIKYVDEQISSDTLQVIITSSDDSAKREESLIRQAIASDVDGIILFPTGQNIESYQMIASRGIPLVYVDRIPKGIDNFNCVLLQNETAINMSVDKLVDMGHSEIAYLSLPLSDELTPRIERYHAFQERSASYHELKSVTISGNEDGLAEQLHNLFAKNQDIPTAFIASNDTCLDVLLREYKHFTKQIKLDIVSIDGFQAYRYLDSIVLSLEHPIEQMGERIISCLGIDDSADRKLFEQGQNIFRFAPQVIES